MDTDSMNSHILIFIVSMNYSAVINSYFQINIRNSVRKESSFSLGMVALCPEKRRFLGSWSLPGFQTRLQRPLLTPFPYATAHG